MEKKQKKVTFNRQEAADYLGVNIHTIDLLMNRKDSPIPYFRVGRRFIIPVESFNQWIEAETLRSMKQRGKKGGN